MPDVPIGFTGTRKGLTPQQQDWLRATVAFGGDFHHGACVGADEMLHFYAKEAGCAIIVHPPINARLRMSYDPYATWMPAKDYLARDRDIVDSSKMLIACPDGPERAQSGTWYTVRYAIKSGVPVTICYPNGSVDHA
ncbi:hypothetical protein VC74_gp49 [Mycobacterium phage Sparky]|uniref:Uncharacterized protein n=2 Tax=Caudoviricetes TaxID=2731619 RepID=A0A076G7X5_9CAUD|nr:hypothetical protein VC74_gp49 [Mycobacterium phage Sparky]AII28221.1 hypothetical protein PBI_SPARKY_77 [Mycobacterium phage Sparky]